MSVVEDVPPPFDASKFVTYQTDELTTPTEKELVEDLPEWEGREAHRIKVEEKETKPRRGVGFLRAEPSTETEESQTKDSLESDFGAGLDEAELKAIAAKNTERPKPNRQKNNGPRRGRPNRQPEAKVTQKTEPNDGSSANDEKDGDDKAPGRKRRRRRGRRNRKDSTPTSGESASTTQASAVIAPASASVDSSGSDVAKPDESGGDQTSKSSGDKRKPRRRRRRGGRNRSNPGNGEGTAPPPAAE